MSDEDIVWIGTFDIGKINFCFYIEEFDKTSLLKLDNIHKTKRYNPDGTTTPEFGDLLRKICVSGKKILLENVDITDNCDKKAYLDPETYHNMTDVLDEYVEYWDKCDAFVIEKQMSFRGKYNTMALKLGQHCYSYFAFKYGRFKSIVEFPAYHKTQVLGAKKIEKRTKKGKISYKAIDKPARKKWAVQKAIAILAEREDFDTLAQLERARKADDYADCILMACSFLYLAYIDKSI